MPKPKRKADDSSSEDDIARFAAVAVTSDTLQKEAAKSAEVQWKACNYLRMLPSTLPVLRLAYSEGLL